MPKPTVQAETTEVIADSVSTFDHLSDKYGFEAAVMVSILFIFGAVLIIGTIRGRFPWTSKTPDKPKETVKARPAQSAQLPVHDARETLLDGTVSPFAGMQSWTKEKIKPQQEAIARLQAKVEEHDKRLGGHAAGMAEIRGDVKVLQAEQKNTDDDVEKLQGVVAGLQTADAGQKSKLYQLERKIDKTRAPTVDDAS